jgi:hypothetical protein
MADMRTKSGKRIINNRYIELAMLGDMLGVKSGRYRDMKQSIDLHRHRERMLKRKEAKKEKEKANEL